MNQFIGITIVARLKQILGNRTIMQIFIDSGPIVYIGLLTFIILLIIGIRIVFKSKSRKKFWIYSLFISLPFMFGVLGSFFGLIALLDVIQHLKFETIDLLKDTITLGIGRAMGPTYFGVFETFILIILVFISLNKQNKKMENIIKERTEELNEEKNIVEEKNKNIIDSIQYAFLIQNSILPRNEEISQYIKKFFIIWKPRDIVGGDFYWFYPIPKSKNYIISVIDCTGHGVPGAFMSMTANSILNNIVREKQIYEPDKILNLLHKEIRYTLRQQAKESQQDGMDISLCFVDVKMQEIHFAGALQTLYFIQKRREAGEGKKEEQSTNNTDSTNLTKIKGNRFSIGGRQKEEGRIFTKHIIQYSSGDTIFLLSDGLADQKVMIDGKEQRFKTQRFTELIMNNNSLSMLEIKKIIDEKIEDSEFSIEQRDDIVVVGLRL